MIPDCQQAAGHGQNASGSRSGREEEEWAPADGSG